VRRRQLWTIAGSSTGPGVSVTCPGGVGLRSLLVSVMLLEILMVASVAVGCSAAGGVRLRIKGTRREAAKHPESMLEFRLGIAIDVIVVPANAPTPKCILTFVRGIDQAVILKHIANTFHEALLVGVIELHPFVFA